MSSLGYVSVDSLPMLDGAMPVVGHMPQLGSNFQKLMFEGRRRHGPLFRIDMARVRDVVVVADLEGMQLLRDRSISADLMGELGGYLLADSMNALDGERHRRLRSALQRPFMPRGLDSTSVGQLIAEEVETMLQRWDEAPHVHIVKEMQRLALTILFRMIGCPNREHEVWTRMYRDMHLATPNLPILLQIAKRAQAKLHARLRVIIEDLRARGERETIVGQLAHAITDDGDLLSIEELVPTLRLIVLAGHETSASSGTSCMMELTKHPEHWRRIVDEVADVERAPRSVAEFAAIPFTLAFVRETIRRHPPVAGVARSSTEAIELLGHPLPARTALFAPVSIFNVDPEIFDDPLEFRPERWLGEGTELREHERLAFGITGPHFCIGYHLSLLELVHLVVAAAKTFGAAGRSPTQVGRAFPGTLTFPLTKPIGSPKLTFR